MTYRVTVVGAGKIGAVRGRIAAGDSMSKLVNVDDNDASRAKALAAELGCDHSSDWKTAVEYPNTDIVVVSTTNDSLARIAGTALAAGKHVLVEKPGATNSKDMRELHSIAIRKQVSCKVGFNHRFHPGIARLHELYEEGKLGSLCFLRSRHGHGGRQGYEKEWRADPLVSGGGELLDQGVHSLDLIGWFMPHATEVAGWTSTCYWRMPVEDNAMLMLAGSGGGAAFLGVSWTQWKPIFSFEVYGSKGFAEVNGLGGAYGHESLTVGRREDGTLTRVTYPQQDESWRLEWAHFLSCISEGREPMSSVSESVRVLDIVEGAYLSAKNSSRVQALTAKTEW